MTKIRDLPKVKVLTTITRDLVLTPQQLEDILVEWFRLEGQLAQDTHIERTWVRFENNGGAPDISPWEQMIPGIRFSTRHEVSEIIGEVEAKS